MEPKRSWWQQVKQRQVTILFVVIILIIAIVLIIVGYRFDWTGFNGTNKSGKTLWDWLQLLIVPIALAVIAIFFNRSERKNEQRVALDNQQETALQEYIKEMSELLLHEKLRESQPEHEVRQIARARTLTVIPRLNAMRKGSLLQFLYEAGLIYKVKPIVDLSGVDLRYADLGYAVLNLADLSKADLSQANLYKVDLSQAVLREADLRFADLHYAALGEADLSGADLREADLREADLRGSRVAPQQLTKAKSLQGAIMPDGSIHS